MFIAKLRKAERLELFEVVNEAYQSERFEMLVSDQLCNYVENKLKEDPIFIVKSSRSLIYIKLFSIVLISYLLDDISLSSPNIHNFLKRYFAEKMISVHAQIQFMVENEKRQKDEKNIAKANFLNYEKMVIVGEILLLNSNKKLRASYQDLDRVFPSRKKNRSEKEIDQFGKRMLDSFRIWIAELRMAQKKIDFLFKEMPKNDKEFVRWIQHWREFDRDAPYGQVVQQEFQNHFCKLVQDKKQHLLRIDI